MLTRPVRIPDRHGVDPVRARRTAAPIRLWVRGTAEPSAEEWQAIGESLRVGDAPMDELIGWMMESGLSRTRPLYERAVRHGIDAVEGAPQPLRTFFSRIETAPDWFDAERAQEGARACGLSGLTGMRVLRDLGLLAGYQASAINHTLVLTGALEKGAQRRVAETTKWWIDCTRPGGMQRGAPGYCGTLQVRLIHGLVRRHVAAMENWDASYYGLPINQGDMHATYLAFSTIFLIGQRMLGVPLSRREGAAITHLWRYIAWLMGVDERWLHADENQGRRALYHNLLAQAPADESSRRLGMALIDEPLQRHYRNLPWLRGRLNRAIHLSIARTFIDRNGREALGLPRGTLPWYPLLTAPPRFAWQTLLRCLPAGHEFLINHGLRQQEAYLQTLFGDSRPRVGTEAAIKSPSETTSPR